MTQPLPLLRPPRRRRDPTHAKKAAQALDLTVEGPRGPTPLWVDALMLGLVLATAYGIMRAAAGAARWRQAPRSIRRSDGCRTTRGSRRCAR